MGEGVGGREVDEPWAECVGTKVTVFKAGMLSSGRNKAGSIQEGYAPPLGAEVPGELR